MVLVACALQTPKLINKYWVSMRNDKIAQNFTGFISAVAKGYSCLTFGASRLVWFFSSPRRKQEAKKYDQNSHSCTWIENTITSFSSLKIIMRV